MTDAANADIEVGVYFDLRNPRQWRQDPARLYSFTLEACEEAERLGAHSAWFTEHHLFDDDYMTSPLTFAAAVAARTRQIRLGTAVVVAPLHHPAEIAEQSVAVDLISDGRLDLGLGAGYRVPEYNLFNAQIERRYTTTDAMAGRLRELWGPGGVRPRPVQDRIPIWQGPQGARRAGLLGERLLSANSDLWTPYSQGLLDGGHSVSAGTMAGVVQAWVTDDPDRDLSVVSMHLAHQLDTYRRHMVEGTGQPVPRPVDPDRILARDSRGPLDYFFYGTPEQVAVRIQGLVGAAPVKTVLLWASLAGMAEEAVIENIRTICTRLAPLLKSQSASVSTWQEDAISDL
ncbi:LLM class flavin-dependent oxidoreductase [Rhodococcus koreensis]|uniref:LLM class flavin-dependent oxidoreductase n=1 Tax=Rhodococcus koreensis TaxID=99653 RepID=UPI003672119C